MTRDPGFPTPRIEADLEEDTLCGVIRRWAEIQPHAPILVDLDRPPLSYGRLAGLMDDFRTALNRLGYGRGNRIAIVHEGGPQAACALLCLFDCATAVPLNPTFSRSEFLAQLSAMRVDAVLVQRGLRTAAREAATELGLPVLDLDRGPSLEAGDIQLAGHHRGKPGQTGRSLPDDDIIVTATSGTTGASKVVPITHSQMLARCRANASLYGLKPSDRCINLMPLYYSGQSRWCGVPYTGGSIVFLSSFSPDAFFRIIESLTPTWYTGGFTFQDAISHCLDRYPDTVAASRLRFTAATSGRLDPEIAKALDEKLHVPVIECYASSEAGYITGNPQPPRRRKYGTVGVPIDAEIRIVSAERTDLPRGEPGEVLVRGPQVFGGYENDPEGNREAFVDGWFRTGDEGFLDEDGYLTLTGRIGEMINRGGEKISPQEVDETLIAHPTVREAVTFPLPHPTLGEVPLAAAVLEPGATTTSEDLRRFLLERLAGFKVPLEIYFVEEIPKGPSGKVQRHRLAGLIQPQSRR